MIYSLTELSWQFVTAFIALLFLLRYAITVYKSYRSPLNKIPGPWYANFTTLHLNYLFAQGSIWKFVEKQHAKYGPVIRLGPRQVWVSDKDALKDILQTTDLPKVSMYAEISRDRYSPGLFGEIRRNPHTRLKRFLGPAFTVASVDKLDNYFMHCTSTLIRNYYEKLEQQQSSSMDTDLMRDLHCVALDIMGESSFGKGFAQIDQVFKPLKVKSARDEQWSRIPDAIFSGLARRYQFVYLKRFLRRYFIDVKFDWPKEMTNAISTLVDERKSDVNSRRCDVLQHVIDEGKRPDNGVRMTNRDVIDQMSELLLAGSETTSGTIACLFLELARNPEVKKKLLSSLPPLGRDDPMLDSKTVREGKDYLYLEACIKENLRMHPIASEMGRRTLESSFNVGEYYLPPYTIVSASYRRLHLDDAHWESPEVFWPERWLEGSDRENAPIPDMTAFYPFSAGRHACIGKNFAYAEIRTVAANLLSRFDIDDIERKSIDFRQFITMQFRDGSWTVRLTPRQVTSGSE